MFGLFKKKSEKEILLKEYAKLMEEAFTLSRTNRTASDAKTAEAVSYTHLDVYKRQVLNLCVRLLL